MEIEIAFGKILKKERTNVSLSQEELAHISNLDRTYISMLERGVRQPSLKTIFSITTALNMLPSDILIKVESLLKK